VNAEDSPEELARRQRAICNRDQTTLDDYHDLYLLSWASQDAAIAASGSNPNSIHPTAAFQRLLMHIEAIRPGLVVLDPLSDLYDGDELRRAPSRQFIGLLRGVALKFDCAILIASHPSLQGMQSRTGSSGSTAWGNSVRVRLYLERIPKGDDPRERILKTTKANYAPDDIVMRLLWKDGVFDLYNPFAEGATGKEEFLFLLRTLASNNIRVSASGGISYAPNVMIKQSKTKLSKQTLTQAMMELLKEGTIENVVEGPPSKRRSYIREKEGGESAAR
jgi:RecA-family ATPase